ncbi:hypothetical protein [Arthrobacter sp.]|uniref:hypothetical protein n=1 Tax=Arthrobacter sp. TaxID=1667 RepID=UPI003A9287DA
MTIAPGGPRHQTRTLDMDIDEVVRELIDVLTANLVASIAGIKDPGQARKWARGELAPRPPAEQRLRFALETFNLIAESSSPRRAQRWFLSINPQLEFQSPIQAIRENSFRLVGSAARAVAEDSSDA